MIHESDVNNAKALLVDSFGINVVAVTAGCGAFEFSNGGMAIVTIS